MNGTLAAFYGYENQKLKLIWLYGGFLKWWLNQPI